MAAALGAGGDIFVMQGATLTIQGGTLGNGTVTNGQGNGGGTDGAAYGAGIFIQGNQSIVIGAGQTAGQTTTVSGDIADMTGSNDPSGQTGAGKVIVAGAGTVVLGGNNTYSGGTEVQGGTLSVSSNANLGGGGLTLDDHTTVNLTGLTTFTHAIALNGDPTIEVDSGSTTVTSTISGDGAELVKTGGGTLVLNPTSGANTYTGGTTISGGTLELATSGAGGTGGITFNGANLTLQLDTVPASGTLNNTIINFITGDTIDLRGLAFTSGETVTFSSGSLAIGNGSAAETLTMTNAPKVLLLESDGHGGTDIVAYNNLSDAIAAVDAQTSGNFLIELNGNETETADPTAINLRAGVSLTIDGNGATLDGGAVNGVGGHRGLFVYSGNVTHREPDAFEYERHRWRWCLRRRRWRRSRRRPVRGEQCER